MLKSKKNIIYTISIILLFFIASLLRIKPAIVRPINFDEAYTAVYLAKFEKIIDIINHDPSVPPLQYLLIKLMGKYSTNLLWFRTPSIIFSIITLYVVFNWIKCYSKKAAFISLFLLTFSILQISYSWQAYVYSQFCLFSLLSIYFFYQLYYKKQINILNSFGFFIFSIASWFTHYSYFWTFLGISLIIVFSIFRTIKTKKIKIHEKQIFITYSLIIVVFLSYTPIFINNFNRALINISWMEQNINFLYFGEMLLYIVGLHDLFQISLLNNNVIYISLIVIIASILVYQTFFNKNNKNNKNIIFLLNLIFVSNIFFPLIAFLIFKQNVLSERGLIITTVIFSIQVGFLLKDISNNKIGIYFSVLFLIFFAIYSRTIDRNNVKIMANQEAAKYYVEWFRKNNIDPNENIYIVLFASEFTPNINFYTNKYVVDYYWYGYDGNNPFKEYTLIDQNNLKDFTNIKFYLLVMENTKKINILDQKNICKAFKKVFEVEQDYRFGIYECYGK